MRTQYALPPFHFLRAASLSTGVLPLAAGAHVAGGGDLPSPGILLAVLALTMLAATTATRLRLNFPVMLSVLGAGQFILHKAFTAFSSSGSPGGEAASGLHAGHPYGDVSAHIAAAPVIAASGHVNDSGSLVGILMLVAHTLATAACALLLAKGEATLWALAAWLRPLVRLPEAVAPDGGTPPSVTGPPAVLPLRPWRNLRQHSRRGPPSAVVLS